MDGFVSELQYHCVHVYVIHRRVSCLVSRRVDVLIFIADIIALSNQGNV